MDLYLKAFRRLRSDLRKYLIMTASRLFCLYVSDPSCHHNVFKYKKIKALLTHPEVVHDLDRLLKLDRNVHGDVVVETRTHGELLWEGRPVVFPA